MLEQTSQRDGDKRGQGLVKPWLRVAFLFAFWLISPSLLAATFTASLDRDMINLGESVTLSLAFADADPQDVPAPPQIPNLDINYLGPSRQTTIIGGQVSSSVTHNYTVTPRQVGDYVIPAMAVVVGNQRLTSQPLTLKVLKPSAPTPDALQAGTQLAFLRLLMPRKEVYLGETVSAQLQLLLHSRVQRVSQFQLTAFPAEGFSVGKMVEGERRREQVGNAIYTMIPLTFPLKVVKAGASTVGPVTASVVVEVPSQNRRRGSPFDMFGMFGDNLDQQRVALATDGQAVQLLPLPRKAVWYFGS